MRDAEAFQTFFNDEMPRIFRVQNLIVEVHGKKVRAEEVFYSWIRCALAHEGQLSKDVAFEGKDLSVQVDPARGLVLGSMWFDALAWTVVHAPENSDQFGAPPRPPFPLTVAVGGVTITLNAGEAPGS